jgi:NAD+ synthase (glutamine-hydrolysing)
MLQHGFVRVAAGLPRLRVADVAFNADRMLALMDQAEEQGVHLLVFPELSLTGYTCGDLFHHAPLQNAALDGLKALLHASETRYTGVFVVGLPWLVGDQLFNVAAVAQKGKLLGVVPKTYLPTYKEYYEARWFTSGALAQGMAVHGNGFPFCQLTDDAIFADQRDETMMFGVEICEDLWVPVPPSSFQAIAGAKILVNLSASNEVIGKAAYRRQLVVNQSGRCIAGYVYAASGVGESSTDLVFGGHAIIAENGVLLAESQRFLREDALLVSDIDLQRLQHDRQQTNTFNDSRALLKGREFGKSTFRLPRDEKSRPLVRAVEAHPFVPRGEEQLSERCHEIFQSQVAGLAKRLEHIGTPAVSIGVSGGLDSTLALLVVCKTFDLLNVPRSKIRALTMPGFGTTPRTRANATDLMAHLQVEARTCDIRSLCLEEMKLLGHAPFGIALDGLTVETFTAKLHDLPADRRNDLVFENVQARMRTNLLMNHGFVVGTGDLSELALGWCTYNGDHISMYNPNVSIPKTLVKFLVRWAAEHEFTGEAQRTLLDIVATRISPELLPAAKDGQITQETESVIGPYELHDFFLFHFLRYAAPPEKILYLAEQAEFEAAYTPDEIRRWLRVFLQRFFANQFKRSCLPDGPKVGSVSLSPRGDWRMPSDAQVTVWLEGIAD